METIYNFCHTCERGDVKVSQEPRHNAQEANISGKKFINFVVEGV
jgi:hypothetical protein